MNITNLHARPTVKASGPSVIMVVGFIVFLVADGTPGGLTGMQGFLWGAGIALACVVTLVIAAIVSRYF